ncbi:MAG: hypothetical protein M0Z51_12055 [Propionibacterium sp.]|nr:hypothetical protein [Propionibacterium sp.]
MRVRAALTTAVEVLGIGLVATGCWLLMPAIGLIAAGLGLILIGARTA